MLIFSSGWAELTYQSLNRALPTWKCSIKAPAKCKTFLYVFMEICLQWSKWLGPKEWKTITRVYPESTSNLNRVTKQVDVDVMDNFGNKLPIKNLKSNIEIIIERLQHKDPAAVTIPSKCFGEFSIFMLCSRNSKKYLNMEAHVTKKNSMLIKIEVLCFFFIKTIQKFHKILIYDTITLFINKRFVLNDMFQRNASKFAIFYV